MPPPAPITRRSPWYGGSRRSRFAFPNPEVPTADASARRCQRPPNPTGLLIHTSDAGGVLRAAHYDSLEAGDLFEWRESDDCLARHQMTEVQPDPAGTVPR